MPTPWHRQQQGNVASFLVRNSNVSSSKCNWTLLQGFVSLVCLYLEEQKVILNSSETSRENRAICIETSIYRVVKATWFAVHVRLGYPKQITCAQPQKGAGASGTPILGLLLTPMSIGCTL